MTRQSAIPGHYRLNRSALSRLQKASDPGGMVKRAQFAKEMERERWQGIERWYSEGGYFYVEWIRQHYKRWTGRPIEWRDPFMEELLLLFGNPWISLIAVTKAAQMGFTEYLISFTAFMLGAVRIPNALGFEQRDKMRDTVAPRVQPALDHCQVIQDIRQKYQESMRRVDTDSKERKITCGGVMTTFFYSARRASKSSDGREVPPNLSSFESWTVLIDEVDACPASTIQLSRERTGACEMQTSPIRVGSTPGAEGGTLDQLSKDSGHSFKWQVICAHCGHAQMLDAFGNLLIPEEVTDESGNTEIQFVDPTGRPYKWFCHCEDDKDWTQISTPELEKRIKSAYVGCAECQKELTWENIWEGKYVCEKTGTNARDFHDQLIKDRTEFEKPVTIDMPRLASSLFKAPRRIRDLVEAKNPADVLQQGLGKIYSGSGGKISLKAILKCSDTPLPDGLGPPTLVSAGVDQGVMHHWGVVVRWWLPDHESADVRWMRATAQLVWYGPIYRFEGIDEIVEAFDVDLVGLDNEPELQMAADYMKHHPPMGEIHRPSEGGTEDIEALINSERVAIERPVYVKKISPEYKGQTFLFDQVHLKGEGFVRRKRNLQGEEVPIFSLHRTFGLDAVRNRIYRRLIHLPELSYDPGNQYNLPLHLMSSDRTKNGVWTTTPGAPDHWFHALNFAEVAVLAHLHEASNSFVFGTLVDR